MASMDIDAIVVRAEQTPGQVSFHNFDELKERIEKGLSVYKTTVYTPDNLDRAQQDAKTLRAIKKKLSEKKKELETAYSMPIETVKAQLDELIDMVKEPLDIIDRMVKENAKQAKRKEIMAYANGKAAALGTYAENVVNSSVFFNPRWLNTTYKAGDWKADVDRIVRDAADALGTINAVGGKNRGALLGFYFDKLSLDGAEEFMAFAESDVAADADLPVPEENAAAGYKVLKVYATERQMLQLMTQLDISGMEYEELEDGMPKPPRAMEELTKPDFDSFVAFDIEHTGTFGISKGDAEAEIIEIGAVKVVHGEVTEKFDMLANPGREIVPMVEKITHITNEMVADEPPVDEVIKKFKDFAGEEILVGHNIKSCDIPHIVRAAKRAGIEFGNAYFDTCRYAKTLKNKKGWERVALPYLSEYYHVQQTDAHRAWCDAEANAYVYLEMRKG